MFNIYGRKLPDAGQIARNLIQLAEEDGGRMRRIALRAGHEPHTCMFGFGKSGSRWWVSPFCFSTLLFVGYLTKDWSWMNLDLMLTRLGFL